jgi:hypothetical protein
MNTTPFAIFAVLFLVLLAFMWAANEGRIFPRQPDATA